MDEAKTARKTAEKTPAAAVPVPQVAAKPETAKGSAKATAAREPASSNAGSNAGLDANLNDANLNDANLNDANLNIVSPPEPVEGAEAPARPVGVAEAPAMPVAAKAEAAVLPVVSAACVPSPNSVPSVAKEIPMTNEIFAKPYETIAPAMEKATADMTVNLKEMMEKNMKSMAEMTEFAKGNVEAMVESAKAAAAGAETLTAHMVETSKKSMEEAQAAFKAITSAKTPNEMMAAQNEFAKAQFDKAVANMSHFSETWMKLAGDVVQPISSRMAVAAETVKKSIAP